MVLALPKIEEVIVVEGKNDTAAILRVVEADTIETRGNALSPSVLEEIKRAQATRGVIVFTDPDYAGERIRRIVAEAVPGVKHAFLPRRLASQNDGVGIEHASPEAILSALNKVRKTCCKGNRKPPITWEEYVQSGFLGKPGSKVLREKVAEKLGIGYANAKQLYKRLTMLGITREEWMKALHEVEKVREL